jgi:hypothetical protein
VLTDNGRQFYSWRGKSKFTKLCIKLGINHIRSRPYHPQTLGKIESFWRNLYQEFLGEIPLSDFEEAQSKIADWIKYYNYKRVHLGIGSLVPADRFFSVREQVEKVIQEGTAQTEKQMHENPTVVKPPMYLVGKIGEKEIRIYAKDGEAVICDFEKGAKCGEIVMNSCPTVDSGEKSIAESGVAEPLSGTETPVTGQVCANPPTADEVSPDGTQNAGKPAQSEPEGGCSAGVAATTNTAVTATTAANESGGQIPPGNKRSGEEGTDIECPARQDNVARCLSGSEHKQGGVLPVDEEGIEGVGRGALANGPGKETGERSGNPAGIGAIAEAEQRTEQTKPETAGEIKYSQQNNGMGTEGQV